MAATAESGVSSLLLPHAKGQFLHDDKDYFQILLGGSWCSNHSATTAAAASVAADIE